AQQTCFIDEGHGHGLKERRVVELVQARRQPLAPFPRRDRQLDRLREEEMLGANELVEPCSRGLRVACIVELGEPAPAASGAEAVNRAVGREVVLAWGLPEDEEQV